MMLISVMTMKYAVMLLKKMYINSGLMKMDIQYYNNKGVAYDFRILIRTTSLVLNYILKSL